MGVGNRGDEPHEGGAMAERLGRHTRVRGRLPLAGRLDAAMPILTGACSVLRYQRTVLADGLQPGGDGKL